MARRDCVICLYSVKRQMLNIVHKKESYHIKGELEVGRNGMLLVQAFGIIKDLKNVK